MCMAKVQLLQHLARRSYVRLAPSPIAGVGIGHVEKQRMDEFHLHVCAEAWRVFGVDMFPKVCDS